MGTARAYWRSAKQKNMSRDESPKRTRIAQSILEIFMKTNCYDRLVAQFQQFPKKERPEPSSLDLGLDLLFLFMSKPAEPDFALLDQLRTACNALGYACHVKELINRAADRSKAFMMAAIAQLEWTRIWRVQVAKRQWLITYFGAVLGCDMPILESLHPTLYERARRFAAPIPGFLDRNGKPSQRPFEVLVKQCAEMDRCLYKSGARARYGNFDCLIDLLIDRGDPVDNLQRGLGLKNKETASKLLLDIYFYTCLCYDCRQRIPLGFPRCNDCALRWKHDA